MKLRTLVSALAAALPLAALAAPTVSIKPNPASAAIGGDVTLTVSISGLTGGDPLTAFDLGISYDTSVLSFVSGSLTASADLDSYFGFWLDSGPTAAGGIVRYAANSIDGDAAVIGYQAGVDGFDLFSLTFHAPSTDTDGTTNVGFGSLAGFYPIMIGLRDVPLAPAYNGTCVQIGQGDCGGGSNVPEPASFGLAALALLAAGAAGRKRHAA